MRTKPQIATISNPIGVDKLVLKIQNKLAAMTYLDESDNEQFWFDSGLIYGMTERSDNDIPVIIWKGVEFHELLPNDNYPSLIFFYEHDNRVLDHSLATYDLSVVVWFDQNRINDGLNYRISEWPIEEIRQVLMYDDAVTDVRLYKDKKSIYSDFNLDYENQIYNDRFDGFRVRFNYTGEVGCTEKFKKKVA